MLNEHTRRKVEWMVPGLIRNMAWSSCFVINETIEIINVVKMNPETYIELMVATSLALRGYYKSKGYMKQL